MFGLFQVASCPSEPWTSDNEHQKVASVICPPSPVDASWCLKNSSGWLPVQIHASGILSTQILSKHPLSILISLIWYLDVLYFFFGDASHIILCCIPYHPHLTNKKLTKSRCPVAMHVAKPGDKKKFRIFDSRQQILIIPCRQNLSTWELESREIEREVTKACRWYGHSVVPAWNKWTPIDSSSNMQKRLQKKDSSFMKRQLKHGYYMIHVLNYTWFVMPTLIRSCFLGSSNAAHFMPSPWAYCTQATMKTFHRMAFECKLPSGSVLDTEKDPKYV